MEHRPVAAMPATLTADALPQWLSPDAPPLVEIQSLDMGYYIVLFHHREGASRLVDEAGETRRFTGTQWISRLLAPLGLTHGTLTWADVTDEMVGLPPQAPALSPRQRLAFGTRVAFMTR
ncbi:MAG: DUF6482 family protein [Pseudomonadota bacterium]